MANNTEKRITAKMILDSSGFNSSLQGVNASLRVSQAELKNASAQVGVFGKNSENLKKVQQALASQVEQHAKKVDIYKQSIEATTTKMNANIAERDRLKASLEKANKAYADAVKMHGKESDEAKKAGKVVDNLSGEYKKAEKTIETNAKAINNYTTNLNKAEAELIKTQGQLNKINKELIVSSNNWTKAGDSIKKVGTRISGVGDNFKNVGEGIVKAGATITTTFGLIGAGSLKAYEEVKKGTDQIARLTGATGEKYTEIKKVFEDTARESANSFEDIGIAVGSVNQRLDLTGDSLKTASLDFMKFAKVNNTDVTSSVALVSRAMGDAGIKTTEYKKVLDLLTVASQKSGINISVLTENLAKYGAPMRALGLDMKQSIALFSVWEKAGVNTEIAFAGMKKAISNWGKAGKDSSEEFKKVLVDIKNTPSLAAATTKAIEIFGQKAGPDLADAIKGGRFSYEDFLNVLKKSDGTLDATAKKMGGHTAEMKKAWHSVTLASAELGESIAKELAPIMKDVAITIKDITKRWDSLSDSTKASIAKFGLTTIAIGGVTTVLGGAVIGIGGFINGIGKIVSIGGSVVGVAGRIAGAFGTASVAAEGATVAAGAAEVGIGGVGAAAGAAAIPLLPLIGVVAAVGAAAVGTAYLLSRDCIPAVDLFGDEVSAATKKSVTAYMDLDKKIGVSLLSFQANNTKITDDIAKDMTSKFKKMGDQIKVGRDKHYDEDLANLKKFYTEQGTINTKEAKDTIAKMKQNNKDKNAEVDTYVEKINRIYKRASKAHREMTKQEEEEVKKLQDLMKQQAIKALTDSEAEQKAILTRIRLQAKNSSTLQASEVISASAKQRNETVRLAKEQYEKTVNSIARQRDEGVIKSDDQAKKMIAAAQRTRDESIKKAKEMHKGVVDELAKQNADIKVKLDESDGHVKSWWERLGDWFHKTPIRASITTGVSAGAYAGLGRPERIFQNYSGTSNFRGGLTTLHEKGYEVYDLPQSTRIYNHEASQDLVMKTAQEVAMGVLNSYGGGSFGQSGQMRIENAKISGSLKVDLASGIANLIDARISADLAYASDLARWQK